MPDRRMLNIIVRGRRSVIDFSKRINGFLLKVVDDMKISFGHFNRGMS